MTVTDSRPLVVDLVSKVADDDEGAALELLKFGFYEALCDEADRIRPMAERRAVQEILKRTEGALESLAKRYAEGDEETKAEASAIADQVLELRRAAQIAKADYLEEHNVVQGEGGKFQRKGVRGAVLDLLGIGTRASGGTDSKPDQTASTLHSLIGSDADTYTRLRTIGQGLVASSNSTARGAGAAARIVGDVGPEAQRALEPGIRRTAYRYRGTERKPNAAAQRQAKESFNSIQGGEGRSQDQARLQALGDFGASLLWRQVPNAETARISLEAGKMPPSVGMMFDADGNLVSEAMGYNGDHYLPFDLKNLKRLRGGSYVRTRTTGGPTDEDIYTALLSGARQIQVISNSGNFVIEFDPTMRGGRRYSDKARSMVDRYGKLVSAIGSGKLMQTDLSPETMRNIRRESFEEAGGDETLARDFIEEKVRRARNEAKFSEADEDTLLREAEDQARKEYKGQASVSQRQVLQRTDEIFKEKVRAQRANIARAYRLDGQGYGAAMKALQTEFPYFIRNVEYQPLHQFLSRVGADRGLGPDERLPNRGGQDIGYTKPGELATYRRQDGTPRSKEQRRGIKPLRGTGKPAEPVVEGASGEQGEKPAEQTGGKGPVTVRNRALPEPDAPSLQELAERNAAEVQMTLQSSMGTAFRWANRVPDAIGEPPVTPDGKDLPDDDPFLVSARCQPPEYLGWLTSNYSDPRKLAAFLSAPDNGGHREKAREAMQYLADLKVEGGQKPDADVFEQAISSLELVDGTGALFEEGEPDRLKVPSGEHPKPQAWPEILELGGSRKNLEAYARAHPKVTEIAAKLQAADDPGQAAVEMLEEPVRQAHLALRSVKVNEVLHGFKGSMADARQYHHLAEKHPKVAQIQDTQLAWALVQAASAVTALTGQEPLRFTDVAPKAKAPEEGAAAKRFLPAPATRVVKVDRESPIARALAARARRP